ncbi:MAG TPA: alpha/beta hydrolase [Candidatus Binataceae bacterium]|nr:alpha/beta hydrolase [Candidatus Binataceae bacterium]
MVGEDEISLRILGVNSGEEIACARRVEIRTTRGDIPLVLHGAEPPGRIALCICGAIGGFDGPALLYARMGLELPPLGIGVARLNYRMPNEFGECVVDTMAGLTFLKSIGYARAALIGHSFGGAVAINAGTLAPAVTTVIALSSQLAGAHVVGELAPRPLLLLHGTADTILSHECSQILYERAREPRTLQLFDGADHRFTHAGDELYGTVRDWLLRRL